MEKRAKTRVIHFSGGQSSAYMTILLKPTPNDIVLFTDTKREHEKTYKFISDFEKYEGIQVHKTARTEHIDTFGALMLQENYLPNVTRRSCTGKLKIETSRRFLNNLGLREYTSHIGFRYDEEQRVRKYKDRYKKVNTIFPLYTAGVTKEQVISYWNNKPYKLEIPSILGNCDLCFLKGKNNLIKIMQAYPQLADKWIHDEEATGHTYIKGITYKELLRIAQSIQPLFSNQKLEDLVNVYNCSCTA
jgi:hypothetical protein